MTSPSTKPGDWIVLQEQDPGGTGPSIGLQVVPESMVARNRVHLDLIPTEGEFETEIRRLESLGARPVMVRSLAPKVSGHQPINTMSCQGRRRTDECPIRLASDS
jgi:hypothetical protein